MHINMPHFKSVGLGFANGRFLESCLTLQVAEIAAKGQVSFQETLAGIAVFTAVAASIYLGTKVTICPCRRSPKSFHMNCIDRTLGVRESDSHGADTQGEPVVCTLCQGNGGARCFGCEGAGSMKVSTDFRITSCRSIGPIYISFCLSAQFYRLAVPAFPQACK